MRHHMHREELSNEGVFSNPLNLLENPVLFENPLSGGAKVAIGVGVIAALGVGVYFLLKPAAASTNPPVTDPTSVQTAQQQLALIAGAGLATGLSPSSYTQAMVNGNPNDPSFKAALAIFQAAVNAHGGYTPPGGTAVQLNTSGVLDQTTAAALAVVAGSAPMKVSATGAPVPDVATSGPYTNITGSSMQPGETYLFSSPAPSGSTVQSAAANLTSAGFTVLQSWDLGQQPASWPIDDPSEMEYRFVIQNNTGSVANVGAGNLYTTGGMTAGLPAGVGTLPPVRACPAGTFFDPTTYSQTGNGCVSSLWQSIAPATGVPSYIQSAFANWYNGSGARPQPLPAGMPAPPGGSWTAVAVIQGHTYYFAARLTAGVGVQWWVYQPAMYHVAPHYGVGPGSRAFTPVA